MTINPTQTFNPLNDLTLITSQFFKIEKFIIALRKGLSPKGNSLGQAVAVTQLS